MKCVPLDILEHLNNCNSFWVARKSGQVHLNLTGRIVNRPILAAFSWMLIATRNWIGIPSKRSLAYDSNCAVVWLRLAKRKLSVPFRFAPQNNF